MLCWNCGHAELIFKGYLGFFLPALWSIRDWCVRLWSLRLHHHSMNEECWCKLRVEWFCCVRWSPPTFRWRICPISPKGQPDNGSLAAEQVPDTEICLPCFDAVKDRNFKHFITWSVVTKKGPKKGKSLPPPHKFGLLWILTQFLRICLPKLLKLLAGLARRRRLAYAKWAELAAYKT